MFHFAARILENYFCIFLSRHSEKIEIRIINTNYWILIKAVSMSLLLRRLNGWYYLTVRLPKWNFVFWIWGDLRRYSWKFTFLATLEEIWGEISNLRRLEEAQQPWISCLLNSTKRYFYYLLRHPYLLYIFWPLWV